MKLPWNREKEGPFIVGICGRSCSGKGVADDIAGTQYEALHVNADIFFTNMTSCVYKGYKCWEHANCIRWPHLVETLTRLKGGEGAIIQDRSLWTGSYDVEITSDDLRRRNIILIEGFLLFTAQVTEEVLKLLDSRLYVDVSDENMLYRRLMRDRSMAGINYIHEIVIPVSKEYETEQKANADIDGTIDGNRTQEEVRRDLTNRLGFPGKKSAWKAHFGDLITDHAWHPVDLSNLKDWAGTEQSLNAMEYGQELFGNTFRYRKNRNYVTYEVKLGEKRHLYRYTREPT